MAVLILLMSVYGGIGFNFDVYAVNRQGYVDATDVHIRADARTSAASLGKISKKYVEILGEKKGTDASGNGSSTTWYNVNATTDTGKTVTGYIIGIFITNITTPVAPSKNFEEQLKAFPESYKAALRALNAKYPNWNFYAENINMTLDEAVNLELTRKQVQTDENSKSWRSMYLGAYDWNTGKWVVSNGGWYTASREVIKYYMDTRNFINDSAIYMFMQQSYDSAKQTEADVTKIIKGTYLEKTYSDPNDTAYGGSYLKVIMAAAKESGVNPCVLASTMLVEQGSNGGNNSLVSGKYPGYEGYYNFFNIQASGANSTEVIVNGLKYAKSKGWNTRSKAIIGGAEFLTNGYISAGQDTYFYMNYNIKNPGSIWHQYAQAAHNALTSGQSMGKNYSSYKEASLDFKIPVYKNMPSAVSALPAKNASVNNYYFNSISVSGLTPSFNRYTYKYDLRVSADTVVKVTVPSGASYSGQASYSLNKGNNTVTLKVRSQTGYTNDYVITVNADKACKLYVDYGNGVNIPSNPSTPSTPSSNPSTPSAIKKGDTNGDGKITLIDLINLQRCLLGKIKLNENQIKAADTNGDGKITLIDLINLQRCLLGKLKLN